MHDSKSPSPTVAEAARRWLQVYVAIARSPRNVLMARQRVNDYLDAFMGNRVLAEIRPDDLRLYRIWLEDCGLAPRSVRHLLGDARCMLNWAVESELLERSPFPRRIMPRIQELPPDRLTDAEVSMLLRLGDPHGFVIRLGLETGLRWGEMCRAEPAHLVAGMLLVSHTKSARLRRVPVQPLLAAEIENRRGRLCPFVVGSAGSFNEFVARESGVARFHVHQLRHTFACRWIERGGSLSALQQILGHASVTTTQVYARLSDDHVRREAERITGNGEVRERATAPYR